MAKYKISNITNSLGKRDNKYNSVVSFNYITGIEKKTVSIPSGGVIFIELYSIPTELHRLRLNGLIMLEEASNHEFNMQLIKREKPNVSEPILVVNEMEIITKELEEVKENTSKKIKKTEE